MKRKKQKLINNKFEILGILIMSLSIMLIMSIVGWDSSEQPNGLFDNSSKNSWFGNFGIYVVFIRTGKL